MYTLSYFTQQLGFYSNINTKEFTEQQHESSLRNQYYKVAVQNHYSKQFSFSMPFSSFGLPFLLLPSCSLTHFVGASAIFASCQDGEELGPPIQPWKVCTYAA